LSLALRQFALGVNQAFVRDSDNSVTELEPSSSGFVEKTATINAECNVLAEQLVQFRDPPESARRWRACCPPRLRIADSELLGFQPMPAHFYPSIALIVVAYIVAAELAKLLF
jgi:hypothetical protein